MLVISSLEAGTSTERALYRWVDENGEVHYTDQIPPDQIKQEHSKLSGQGILTDIVPQAPTPEEVQKIKEQEKLRAEAARRLEQQRALDQKLLDTYRTIDDLILAQQGKLAAIDAQIQVRRDEIRFIHAQLRKLHADLKDFKNSKSAGKTNVKTIKEALAKTEQRLRDVYYMILEWEFKKIPLSQEFAQTQEHYRQLQHLSATSSADSGKYTVPNLVTCQGNEVCNPMWEKALNYVRTKAQAQGGDELVGKGLLITAQHDAQEDRRFTLVWMQKSPADPVYLYLDLQCKSRLTTSITCIDQTALQVQSEFQNIIAN